MRGSGHSLLQALFRRLPEWNVSLRNKSHHGDRFLRQHLVWKGPKSAANEEAPPTLKTIVLAVDLQLFAWGRCFCSRRLYRESWSQQRCVVQSLDSKARIMTTDYFVWQLTVANSCRLAYLINVAHSAEHPHVLRCSAGNWQGIAVTENNGPKSFK
jgi:hypothetical protein